ncbi:MAG: hypothetical protein HYX92_20335 [Chloroflexi bacterium]|nr:hypothetical protein [Chloroflexota bacterium]
MELSQYWKILRRRWWVVVVLALVAAGASFAVERTTGLGYTASLRIIVSVPPEPRIVGGSYYTYDRYYSWLSSEYLTDDLGEVVKSRAFSEDMRAELSDDSLNLTIFGERGTKKTHRILSIKITSPDKDAALRTADAAARVIEKKGKDYLAQLSYGDAVVRVIDPPVVAVEGGGARAFLNIGLRTALGLFAGLALAFLMHYLDNAIYDAEDAERALGVRVLGELPPEA